MATKVVPLTDHIVLQSIDEEEVTVTGLVIPDSAKEKPQQGDVVAVGPGKMNDAGVVETMDLSAGDRVLYQQYAGTKVQIEKVDYIVVRFADVLARLDQNAAPTSGLRRRLDPAAPATRRCEGERSPARPGAPARAGGRRPDATPRVWSAMTGGRAMPKGKILRFDETARAELRRGVDSLADAVRITLGPRGRNVVLDKTYLRATFTKDGVTVAREISLANPFHNMGAQLVKEVAVKTNDDAGDGTTTATVLAQAIYHEGLRNIAAGANPMALRRGLERACEAVTDQLTTLATPVESQTTVRQVATIAANSDQEIGDLITDVMDKVGRDGVITVEEGKSLEHEHEIVEGLQVDNGWMSPLFATDRSVWRR